MLILQTLSVTWTKKGRGAPLATRRNRLPRALPLPEVLLAGAQGWHQQHWSEPAPADADFFAHAPTVKICPSCRPGSITVWPSASPPTGFLSTSPTRAVANGGAGGSLSSARAKPPSCA